ncbi:MAG: hypothetical protein HWD61_00870 [Parachlamydiaceae bacterium]|nr:MAG: hypothetical protein HWD61_00870 [Parachlamydiaceae bacterium]
MNFSAKDLKQSVRHLLSGDEEELLRASMQEKNLNPKNYKSLIERNYKMVERSESHFAKIVP